MVELELRTPKEPEPRSSQLKPRLREWLSERSTEKSESKTDKEPSCLKKRKKYHFFSRKMMAPDLFTADFL